MEDFVEYNGRGVIIMCCSDCNMKCKHCYIGYEGNIEQHKLYEMCCTLANEYEVIINGTEVLLNEAYIDSLYITNQKRVLTNGLIIHNNSGLVQKDKQSGTGAIAMSYHFGMNGKINDTSLKMIIDNIKLIKSFGLEATFLCTITKDNFDKVEKIVDRAVDSGANSIRFFNYLKTGSALRQEEDLSLSDEMLVEFFKQIESSRKKYGKDVIRIRRNGTFGANPNLENRKFDCYACYDEVIIAPDMKVYLYIYLIGKEYEIGEYIDGKIMVKPDFTHTRKRCLALDKYNRNVQIEL